MRRVLFGMCCAAVLAFPVASSSSADKPALQLLKASPFVVRGTHFKPSERVTVTLLAKEMHRKAATAGSAGGFTVTFAGVSFSHCDSYGFSAVGNKGSRASYKIIGECPPPNADQPLFPIDPTAGKKKP